MVATRNHHHLLLNFETCLLLSFPFPFSLPFFRWLSHLLHLLITHTPPPSTSYICLSNYLSSSSSSSFLPSHLPYCLPHTTSSISNETKASYNRRSAPEQRRAARLVRDYIAAPSLGKASPLPGGTRPSREQRLAPDTIPR